MTSLLETLNLAPYDFYFLVVDQFLDISLPEISNFISISPEKIGISLPEKNSGRLLSHPKTIEFIKQHSQSTGRQPAIIPFKPSARIEHLCTQNNWLLISNPASLNRYLEDKIKFVEICHQQNFPQIPNLVISFNQENYSRAMADFGSPLVIQTHFGWAGNSSHLSNDFSDVQSLIAPGTIVKFSKYLPGYSLINNCCLTGRGLITSPPGLQYTGLSQLTDNPLATVGRQWPSQAPAEIISQINALTESFSEYLKTQHFRGFFGLDFLVSEDKVYLLECNARLTASFAFYTEIEKNAGYTPLFYYHLSEFCNLPTDISGVSRSTDPQLIGSEITRKDANGVTIKKYHQFSTFSPSADPVSISPAVIANVL